MFPHAFDYVAAGSAEEALEALGAHGPDTKVLAGGQSLLPLMKLRLAAPRVLVDINGVREWESLVEDESGLRVGALVRHNAFTGRGDGSGRYPLLEEAAGQIADPLVRNRGTMAGSLAHADPAADWGAVLVALGASATVRSPRGTRRILVQDLLVDVFTTSLEADEIITGIEIPRPEGRPAGAYLKLERKVGDFAVVGVALAVECDPAGIVRRAGIGLAAVGPKAIRAEAAEAALIGQPLGPALAREAADLAQKAADPVSDQRGSAAYKRDVVRVFVVRGLEAIRARLARTA
ncbi:MAG: xanthine dehydrogenase family protein subunit M [Actinomycetia bacterium]|nr:xanthine dehydrogenase family protein subunit M [Actinomycetes bacterium]